MLNTDLKGEKDQEDGIIKRKSNLSFWVPIDLERVDGRARAAQRVANGAIRGLCEWTRGAE